MPRNLLFIFTDQQRPDTLAAYAGVPPDVGQANLVEAPNLNALAESATVFERACCAQPVCTPSRATLLTGLYPHTHGCIENNTALSPAMPTLAEMISPEYARAYMGKWHLGDEIFAQRGFDTWLGTEDNYRKHYSRPEYAERFSDYHHYLIAQGFEPDKVSVGQRIFSRERACRMPEPHTKARFTGRAAAEFIRANAGRPWVLYAGFLEPHPPYLGPLDDHYPPEAVPDGPTFLRPPPGDAPLVNQLLSAGHRSLTDEDGQDLRTEAGWRKTRTKYLGNVTLVDRAVGDMLQALEDSGQAQDTIVVFTSDHGDQMGDHGLLGKTVMYEESQRVPLLLRAPWLERAPRRVSQPINQVDLVPTLLELLDQPVPAHIQGRSRAAALAAGQPWADDVIVEWNGVTGRGPGKVKRPLSPKDEVRVNSPRRSLISPDGWKATFSAAGEGELYHLAEDPHEQRNLFAEPAHRARIENLAARLRAWQAQTDDKESMDA